MENSKPKRNLLYIILLIIAAIIIIVLGFFVFKLNDDNNKKSNKVQELQNKIDKLENNYSNDNADYNDNDKSNDELTNQQDIANNNEGKINEISEIEKQKIYNAAIGDNQAFAIILLSSSNEDYFSDDVIIRSLPYAKLNIFSDSEKTGGFYVEASIDDIQNASNMMFGKSIDISKVTQENNNIEVNNSKVIIPVVSGFGVSTFELLSVDEIENDKYEIKFNFTDANENTDTYILTVNYNENKIVYRNIKKVQ